MYDRIARIKIFLYPLSSRALEAKFQIRIHSKGDFPFPQSVRGKGIRRVITDRAISQLSNASIANRIFQRRHGRSFGLKDNFP